MSSCGSPVAVTDPALLRPCDKPELLGDTWRDLAEAYIRRGDSLDECNARLRLLREAAE